MDMGGEGYCGCAEEAKEDDVDNGYAPEWESSETALLTTVFWRI